MKKFLYGILLAGLLSAPAMAMEQQNPSQQGQPEEQQKVSLEQMQQMLMQMMQQMSNLSQQSTQPQPIQQQMMRQGGMFSGMTSPMMQPPMMFPGMMQMYSMPGGMQFMQGQGVSTHALTEDALARLLVLETAMISSLGQKEVQGNPDIVKVGAIVRKLFMQGALQDIPQLISVAAEAFIRSLLKPNTTGEEEESNFMVFMSVQQIATLVNSLFQYKTSRIYQRGGTLEALNEFINAFGLDQMGVDLGRVWRLSPVSMQPLLANISNKPQEAALRWQQQIQVQPQIQPGQQLQQPIMQIQTEPLQEELSVQPRNIIKGVGDKLFTKEQAEGLRDIYTGWSQGITLEQDTWEKYIKLATNMKWDREYSWTKEAVEASVEFYTRHYSLT